MQTIRFGSDGWTARLGEGFVDENVVRVADAVAKLWGTEHPGSRVYIGYDTRREAMRLARLAGEVIAARGLDVVISSSVCPTPAIGWTVARDDAACGGIVLTANDAACDYLGIRIRVADGSTCPEDDARTIEALIDSDPTTGRGEVGFEDILTPYLSDLAFRVEGGTIAASGVSIVHDSMYGATRGLLDRVLSLSGLHVDEIHSDPDERLGGIHPEPVEPWVDDCEQEVVSAQAGAGIVCDGDGDRFAAVDERGSYVGPQVLDALLLQHLVEDKGMSGRVVMNLAGSTYLRRQAKRLGCPLTVTPIGFNRAHKEMLRGGVLLATDGEGGVAIPSHFIERDGIYASLLLVELMAMRGRDLGQLVDDLDAELGHLEYGKKDVRFDAAKVQAFRNLLPGICPETVCGMVPVEVGHGDGLRLRFDDDSWLLLRPSRTEAFVRVYAEASTVEQRDALISEGCAIAKGEGARAY